MRRPLCIAWRLALCGLALGLILDGPSRFRASGGVQPAQAPGLSLEPS